MLPFGVHPTKAPARIAVKRGYDYSIEDSVKWTQREGHSKLQATNPFDELRELLR